MPGTRPVASRTAKGSMLPFSCKRNRPSMPSRIFSGDGTEVYQSCQSSPSRAASIASASCARESGSSAACRPVSVTGCAKVMVSAIVPLHEHQFLEQRDVLLVLQQRAHQRRHGYLVVLAVQRGDRDVLGDEQLEPVEQFAG